MPLHNIFNRFKRIGRKQMLIAGVFTCSLAASIGAGVAAKGLISAAVIRDCSVNSVDYKNLNGGCGAADSTELIKDIRIANPADLPTVYGSFGLTSANYPQFQAQAKNGMALTNGDIVVDGITVAHNAWSIGRDKFSYSTNYPVGSKMYYQSLHTKVLKQNLPAMVMFDGNGKMQYFVLNACGNPGKGTPVTPTYSCNELRRAAVTGQANTWRFNTVVGVANGAKIAKVVYNFGDGSKVEERTNPLEAVTHTFTKSSQVSVTVYISLPGGATKTIVPAGRCITQITVVPPAAVVACEALSLTPGKPDDQTGNTEYTLAAKASAKNATINSYTFQFGDQQSQKVTTSGTTASTTHTYKPGNYTASVSVNVTTNTGAVRDVTSAACTGPIKVEIPECKPGVPVGDKRCKPSVLTCVQLTLVPGSIDQTGNQAYALSAQATADNATITGYVFNFGDNTAAANITTGATTASTTHTYAPGDYTASVSVLGTDAEGNPLQATAPACAKPLTVKTLECKPGVPVGSPECTSQPCTEGGTPAPGSPECTPTVPPQTPPVELPNTGPGQVIGMFSGVSLAGAAAHRWFMNRRSRES